MFGKSKNTKLDHPGLSSNVGSEASQKSPAKRSHKNLIVGLIVFLAIALAATAYIYFNFDTITNKKTLNNNRLYNEAVKSFENLPGVKNLSKEDRNNFKSTIMPEYLAAYVAGFAPDASDLGGENGYLSATKEPFMVDSSIKMALQQNTERVKMGNFYEAYLFQFWYGSTIVNKFSNEDIKDWGNKEVLQSDRDYALAKANDYRKQLIDKKITPEELATKIKGDTRLALYDEYNGSGKIYRGFGVGSSGQIDDGRMESFNKVISEQKDPIITDIYPIIADPGIPRSGKKREVGYFFVDITKVLKSQETIDFYNAQLDIARKKLK